MQGIREHLERNLQIATATYTSAGPRLLTGSVARFDPEHDVVLSEAVRIAQFDLERLTLDEIHFSRDLVFPIVRPGNLNAFFVWFVAILADEVRLTNSPFEPRTHWRQLRLHDFPPREVRPGDDVRARISYREELTARLL